MTKFQLLSFSIIVLVLSACQQGVPEVMDPLPGQWVSIPNSESVEIRTMLLVPKHNILVTGNMPKKDSSGLKLLDVRTNKWTNIPGMENHIIPSLAVHNEQLYCVQFSNENQPGALWVSDETCETWTNGPVLPEGADPRCLASVGENKSRLLLGTVNKGIFFSDDQGETWQSPEQSPNNIHIQGFAVNPANPLHILVGLMTGVSESYDGGITWTDITPRLSQEPVFIVTVDAHPRKSGTFTIIHRAPSGKASIIISHDDAKTWQPIQQGLYDDSQPRCIEFHHSNDNVFYCGTVHDGVYYTNDSGLTWQPINTGLPLKTNPIVFHCLEMIPGTDDVLLAGSNADGQLFTRTFK